MFHKWHDFLASKVVREPLKSEAKVSRVIEAAKMISFHLSLTLVHSLISATNRSSDSSFSGTDSISLPSNSCGGLKMRLDNKNEKAKFCGWQTKKNDWKSILFVEEVSLTTLLRFFKISQLYGTSETVGSKDFLTWSISIELCGISRAISASSDPFNCGVKIVKRFDGNSRKLRSNIYNHSASISNDSIVAHDICRITTIS